MASALSLKSNMASALSNTVYERYIARHGKSPLAGNDRMLNMIWPERPAIPTDIARPAFSETRHAWKCHPHMAVRLAVNGGEAGLCSATGCQASPTPRRSMTRST